MRTFILTVAALVVVAPAVAGAQAMAPAPTPVSAQSQTAMAGTPLGPATERFIRARMERFIACSPYEPYRQAVDGAVLEFGRRLSLPEAETAQRLRDSAARAAGADGAGHFARCGELGGVWGLAP